MIDDAKAAAVMYGDAELPAQTSVTPTRELTAGEKLARLFSGPEPQRDVFAQDDAVKPKTDTTAGAATPEPEKTGTGGEPVAPEKLVEELGLDAADPMTGDFAKAASELGLDADGARRLVDLELDHRAQYWDRQSQEWMAELRASGDIAEMGKRARAVVSRFGDANTTKDLSVYGNHPGLIRLLDRIGREFDL